MESGVEYRFPVFEGKFSKFNNFPVKRCQRIPLNSDNDHVYIVYTTDKESLHQDGFKWSAGNKSNKEFFKNISNVQRAIKYKCSIFGCPAVKFVDTVLSHFLLMNHMKSKNQMMLKEGHVVTQLITTE